MLRPSPSKIRVYIRLPAGELKNPELEVSHMAGQILSMLEAEDGVDYSMCIIKFLDHTLDLYKPLQEQAVKENDLLELFVPNNIEISYKDLALRLRTREDFYLFFTELNQRLMPSLETVTPEYFQQVLTGQKEALRLLDVREYYFPEWILEQEKCLSAENLYGFCMKNAVLRKFVPKGCKDQLFLLRILASLDYGYLARLDASIKQSKKAAPERLSPALKRIKLAQNLQSLISRALHDGYRTQP